MQHTALITGASSGIGLELARVHAATGGNLVLVARNKIKLDELKTELENKYKASVFIIVKDLSVVNAGQEIYTELQRENIKIDYLINNAGFGDFGMFLEADWSTVSQMIQVNITALTQLTKLFLPHMLARKNGHIMNVASTAAFLPGPTMAVYFATKAYVLSFSEAVNNEIKNSGVTITALCPGATESGFQFVANMEESSLVKGKKLPTSKEVAEYGYHAMHKGKSVAIHGFMNYLMVNSVRFAPRSWVVKLVRKIQKS